MLVSADEASCPCSSATTTTPIEQSTSLEQDPAKLFALAFEHQNRGEHEQALNYYQMRLKLGGSDVEMYNTMMGIALMKERLNMPAKEVEDSFEIAYSFQNTRAEPLYCLGVYYRTRGDFVACYRVLKVAVKIPFPEIETDRHLYEWGIMFAFSISAHQIGQYKDAMAAYDALIANVNVPIDYRKAVYANRQLALSQMKDPRFMIQSISSAL
jgi:tetratricopeptide (TPR) repeat protein